MDRIKNFIKTKWWLIIGIIIQIWAIIVFINSFFDDKKMHILNSKIVDKAKENAILIDRLSKNKLKIDSLTKRNDSLLVLWNQTSKEMIVNKIKAKNNEKYNKIANSNADLQFKLLSEWLSKESNNR